MRPAGDVEACPQYFTDTGSTVLFRVSHVRVALDRVERDATQKKVRPGGVAPAEPDRTSTTAKRSGRAPVYPAPGLIGNKGHKMSWQALTWATGQKVGKSGTKFALIMLANHCDDSFTCFVRVDTLADEMDMGESTLYAHLDTLERQGKIRVLQRWHKRKGGRRANRYQLLPLGEDTPLPESEDWSAIRSEWRAKRAELDAQHADDADDVDQADQGAETIAPKSGGIPDQRKHASEFQRYGDMPLKSGGTNLPNLEVSNKEEILNLHVEPPSMGAPSTNSAAASAGDGMDGEISSDDKDRLNGAVVEVGRLRPGWDRPGVIAIIRKALAAGYAPARIARLFVECAHPDSGCKTPGAVLHRLATEPSSTSSTPGRPALADVDPGTPKRVVDRTDRQCAKHRGELADNCHRCAADAKADDQADDAGPAMDGAAARAAIRAATGAARAKRATEAAEYATLRERARVEVYGEPAPAVVERVDQADAEPAEVVEIGAGLASPIRAAAVA